MQNIDNQYNGHEKRKPAKRVKCPHCPLIMSTRGIVNHLKLTHQVAYIEIERFQEENGLLTVRQRELKAEKEKLIKEIDIFGEQLKLAHQNRQQSQMDKILDEIEKRLIILALPHKEVKSRVERYREQYKLQERVQPNPEPASIRKVKKRLVILLDERQYREINLGDYHEVMELFDQLEAIKDQLKEQRQRYRDVPALLKLERLIG